MVLVKRRCSKRFDEEASFPRDKMNTAGSPGRRRPPPPPIFTKALDALLFVYATKQKVEERNRYHASLIEERVNKVREEANSKRRRRRRSFSSSSSAAAFERGIQRECERILAKLRNVKNRNNDAR